MTHSQTLRHLNVCVAEMNQSTLVISQYTSFNISQHKIHFNVIGYVSMS